MNNVDNHRYRLGHWILGMGLLLYLTVSQALQTFAVKENATVNVTIAQHHKTRLTIKGERIQQLYGTPEAYAVVSDEQTGDVYLLPNPAFFEKPFTLFITTENGHHYQLNITTHSSLGDTVCLVPEKPSISIQKKSLPYEQRLIQLIKVQKKVNELSVSQQSKFSNKSGISSPLHYRVADHLILQEITRVHEGNLQLTEYRLSNEFNNAVFITPQLFYQTKVLAIGYTQSVLMPHQSTTLWVISNTNGNKNTRSIA